MKTYTELLPHIESRDYETNLWNAMRGRRPGKEVPASGLDLSINAHALPSASQDKYMAALKKEIEIWRLVFLAVVHLNIVHRCDGLSRLFAHLLTHADVVKRVLAVLAGVQVVRV